MTQDTDVETAPLSEPGASEDLSADMAEARGQDVATAPTPVNDVQHTEPEDDRSAATKSHQAGESELYRISHRIDLAYCTQLHERAAHEPLYRKLQVYSINPGVSKADAGIAESRVP